MNDTKDLEDLLYAIKFDADNAIRIREQSNFRADMNAIRVFERISKNTEHAEKLLKKLKKKES